MDKKPWWRHQMETFSALLALCAGNSPVAGEFPSQRPVTRSFDVFFDLRLNKRLSKQSRRWWFETPSRSLWLNCNEPSAFHMNRRLNFDESMTSQFKDTYICVTRPNVFPDNTVHGANMGPIWGRQDPGGPHVGPMNFAIWVMVAQKYRGQSWWRHQMGTVSALLALGERNPPVTGGFLSQRAIKAYFDVYVSLNKRSNKPSSHIIVRQTALRTSHRQTRQATCGFYVMKGSHEELSFGAKPLPEPMLIHCLLNPFANKFQCNFNLTFNS